MALSDPGGILATPLAVIDRRGEPDDVQPIIDIITRNNVKQLVVGLPRSMDGSSGTQAEKVKELVSRLTSRTDVPVVFRDERLSTISARRWIGDATTRKGRQRKRDDDIAATIILQSYLDERPS